MHTSIREDFAYGGLLIALAALTTMVVVPTTFALFDDDRLRMSNDYAAINATISLAILLIGVVDMHFHVSKAKALAAAGPLTAIARRGRRRNRTFQDLIESHMTTLANWAIACASLAVSLILMALWAAIEDHGPARWLAWYSLVSVGFSLGVVLMTCMDKLVEGMHGLLDLVPPTSEDPQDASAAASGSTEQCAS
ncbi:hypothetical protein [Streptomyces sp. NPDC059862]|uniref:hypothetical protein n=1 Tax=unclassified Streptomyces TaxID=2593676 RepID=UPI0036410F70